MSRKFFKSKLYNNWAQENKTVLNFGGDCNVKAILFQNQKKERNIYSKVSTSHRVFF